MNNDIITSGAARPSEYNNNKKVNMKKLTSILIAALIVFCAALLASCSASENGGEESSALEGEWKTAISFKDLLASDDTDAAAAFESLGIDLSEYAVTLVFNFKSSGNMTVSVDSDKTEESARALFEEYIDRVVENSGKSEEEVLSSMDYSDKEEAIDDMIKSIDFSSFGKEAIKYTYSGGVLCYGEAKIKCELSGDTLALKEAEAKSEKDGAYAFIEAKLPMTLTKR